MGRAGIHVTNHSIIRYQERVSPVSIDEARRILSSEMIARACAFGARFVRLGTGQRIVLEGYSVVTVLPREHSAASMTMERDWKFKREAVNG